MNIYPTIVKSKVLSNGQHKIRLAVSHRCQTRYITTRFIIPGERNLNKKGDVVGTSDATQINISIRRQIKDAYDICDSIENINLLTCSQLVEIIENKGLSRPLSFDEMAEAWIESKVNCKKSTIELYKVALDVFRQYKGGDFVMSSLTPAIVSAYHAHLKRTLKYSNVSIRIKMNALRGMVIFAIRRGYVSYKIHPFVDFKQPPSNKRNIKLTVEQLRTFMAYEPKTRGHKHVKAMFFLSFFMCGMNPIDLANVNFNLPSVSFIREKTRSRRMDDMKTEFSIQPEALRYFNELESSNGYISKKYIKNSRPMFFTKLSNILFDGNVKIMIYSARKTFAQLAAKLEIPDSIIEYCIGDANTSSVISFYRQIDKEIADKAIRKVFDYVMEK